MDRRTSTNRLWKEMFSRSFDPKDWFEKDDHEGDEFVTICQDCHGSTFKLLPHPTAIPEPCETCNGKGVVNCHDRYKTSDVSDYWQDVGGEGGHS